MSVDEAKREAGLMREKEMAWGIQTMMASFKCSELGEELKWDHLDGGYIELSSPPNHAADCESQSQNQN